MSLQKWIKISLINFLIVALIGVLLRYKILFSLPIVDQKHLLHGHSHFAFTGWITMIIMAFIVQILSEQKKENCFIKYKWILLANLFAAFGMLLSFPIQGYGLVSICFSTLSIFVAYIFGIMVWKDINALKNNHLWGYFIKSAIVFNVISSAGAFALAYLMINRVIHQNWYIASQYFFLHFQYNGWFLFSIAGLLMYQLQKRNLVLPIHKTIFYLFVFACVPAYFLSTLWMKIPMWVYILVILAAIAQAVGWALFLLHSRKNMGQMMKEHSSVKFLFILVAIAFSIKICLQLGSTIPFLSTLAFGYRPIVIGYLHLVLLGVISLFLLGYIFLSQFFQQSSFHKKAIIVFAVGVILNELLLMIQGVTAMGLIVIPYVNEMLLFIALVMFLGLLMLNVKHSKLSQ